MDSWITKSKIKCLYKAAFEADKKRKECTESCSKAIGPEDRVVCCLVFWVVLGFFFVCGYFSRGRLLELTLILEG